MRIRASVAILIFATACCAQDAAMLEDARRIALNYSKQLPDFICTEVVHRYETYGTSPVPRQTDVLSLQLSYFQFHEIYKLVSRNGKPSGLTLEAVGGAISQGEFGSKLLLIFHPMSKTEFELKRSGTLGSRRVAVYGYRIERENSRFELRVGTESVIAGYHGDVYIDSDTHLVLRIDDVIDVPKGFPIDYTRDRTGYSYVKVAGREVLLPVRCESWSADMPARPANQIHYHNVIEFKDYRKYEAESTLSFDK